MGNCDKIVLADGWHYRWLTWCSIWWPV